MCAARARPRGASFPLPHHNLGLGVSSTLRVSPPLGFALPALPPSFSPLPPGPPLWPTASLGYRFRVSMTSGVRERRRLGVGHGRTALMVPR